jgi:hypothetical protein
MVEMTAEQRAALRILARSYPDGSTVPVPCGWLLELLEGGEPSAGQPALEQDLTCKAAGAVLGRHDSTIRAMCERGEFIGAYRHRGREWRIPPAAIRAYQDVQRTGKAPLLTGGKLTHLNAWRSVPTDKVRTG